MELRAKKKKKAKSAKQGGAPFITTGLTALACLAAVISFISVELGLLIAGFTAVTSFVLLDGTRRKKWEDKVSGSMSRLHARQDSLEKKIARQGDDIERLHDELSLTVGTVRQRGRIVENISPKNEQRLRFLADKKPPAYFEQEEEQAEEEDEYPPSLDLPDEIKRTIANDDPHSDGSSLSDMVVRELVHHAVRNERIEVFVQPIVRLPQRKARFFEIYARIRAKAGVYLSATRYMEMAKKDRVVDNIDTLLLTHCLRTIKDSAHIKRATPFFINVTPSTIKNTTYMKGLLQFLARNRRLAPRLVFEIRQADFDELSIPLLQILDGLGKLGCAFSLDHVRREEPDIALLQKYKVRFVKFDAAWMLGEMKTERQFNDMARMKRKLEANGIGVIAEKIETEHALKELLDYDIHYGQGFLFGKPGLEGAYRLKKAA